MLKNLTMAMLRLFADSCMVAVRPSVGPLRVPVSACRDHLALVMDYADGGDMSQAVDDHVLMQVWLRLYATCHMNVPPMA